jgi:uncharacterized protein YggE
MHILGKTAIAVVTLGAVVGLTACSSGSKEAATPIQLAASSSDGDRASIRVNGHGEVEGTPDVMTITMGVETKDASAQGALNRNNERARAMIDSLKAQGIADKDIQTLDISVDATYDLGNKVTGYNARNTITAKLRDIKKAGQVIDTAAETAGDDIRLQGVQFSIDDTSTLIAKARAEAVKDGSIHTIDNTGTSYQPYAYSGFAEARSAADSIAIEPGSQELSVDVTVIFDIG